MTTGVKAASESDHDSVNDECDWDAIGESNDVILLFIAADMEDMNGPPATTRSGWAITRRAEIDFSFFWVEISFQQKQPRVHFVNIPSTASTFQKLCYHNEIVIMQCEMQHLKWNQYSNIITRMYYFWYVKQC